MTRLLFIFPPGLQPGVDNARDRFTFLSAVAEGEALLPIPRGNLRDVAAHLRAEFPVRSVGAFRYHMLLGQRWPKIFRKLSAFIFYLHSGLRLNREKRFDAVIAYGTNLPALAGLILKRLTGAKLIVEVPGVPENAFRFDRPRPGPMAPIKRFLADRLLCWTGRRADCLSLLYPSQLQRYPTLRKTKTAVLHAFVPTSLISAQPSQEHFVLSVGHPWFTKGMDILIRAFLTIAPEFPDWKLKLLGFFPDRTVLDELRQGCSQIEFLAARYNDETVKIIGACEVYVLASRTESMGRVLLEAMAAGRPIIASNVGGVPNYVTDGENGLLFQRESILELAGKLRQLMSDPELRIRLGRNGLERVYAELDEQAYVRGFAAMLKGLGLPSSGSAPELEPKAASRSGQPKAPQGVV